MNTIIILGAGQIGQGVYEILRKAGANRKPRGQTLADTFQTYRGDETFVDAKVQMWDKIRGPNVSASIDIGGVAPEMLVDFFVGNYATHIVNAMPFSLKQPLALDATTSTLQKTMRWQRRFKQSTLRLAVQMLHVL